MKDVLDNAKERMEKTLKVLASDFAAIRAGRANPAVLDRISVDYYGTPTPIQQMAAVSVQDARVLVIQPWDKSSLKSIEKAIQASDLGINPANDGSVIRLAFPRLTEERRKELSKDTEDDVKLFDKDIQKLTDKYIENIDSAVSVKEKEIMTV